MLLECRKASNCNRSILYRQEFSVTLIKFSHSLVQTTILHSLTCAISGFSWIAHSSSTPPFLQVVLATSTVKMYLIPATTWKSTKKHVQTKLGQPWFYEAFDEGKLQQLIQQLKSKTIKFLYTHYDKSKEDNVGIRIIHKFIELEKVTAYF